MEFPTKEILLLVFGGGLTGGIIQLSKELRERVAEKKRQKLEADSAHLSQTVELRRLDSESDKVAWDRIREMLASSEREIERLKLELKSERETSSLSGATVQKWYRCYRETGVEIDKLETKIIREKNQSELLEAVAELRRKYNELGDKMPGNNQ